MPFIDLHHACGSLVSTSTSDRVTEFAERFPGVWVAGVGGFPILQEQNVSLWCGSPVHFGRIRAELKKSLGLSAVLTYMNKSGMSLNRLGDICIERGHDWGWHWVTLNLLFSGVPLRVELAFARDTRFRLSWPVTRDVTEPRVFMASASFKDWLKFTSNHDDPDFDAETRKAMGIAFTWVTEMLPEVDREQHFLTEPGMHIKALQSIAHKLAGREVLEIGAGMGALTQLILGHPVKTVHAFEIQPGLCSLEEDEERLELHETDIRNAELDAFRGVCLISNPPYALLPHIFSLIEKLALQDVMLLVPEKTGVPPGYRLFGVVKGSAFTPPSTGLHLIILKGFE